VYLAKFWFSSPLIGVGSVDGRDEAQAQIKAVGVSPYLLVYPVDDDTHEVWVLRFWHAKRNPAELPLDLD
jgi:hypothetical protein